MKKTSVFIVTAMLVCGLLVGCGTQDNSNIDDIQDTQSSSGMDELQALYEKNKQMYEERTNNDNSENEVVQEKVDEQDENERSDRKDNVFYAVMLESAINSAIVRESSRDALSQYSNQVIAFQSQEFEGLPQEFKEDVLSTVGVDQADGLEIKPTAAGETGYAFMVDIDNDIVNVYISTEAKNDAWLVMSSASSWDDQSEEYVDYAGESSID